MQRSPVSYFPEISGSYRYRIIRCGIHGSQTSPVKASGCIRRNQVAAFAATWLRRMQMRDLANARRNVEMILQDDEFARTTELISK